MAETIKGFHLSPAFAYTVAGGLLVCGVWLGATEFRQQETILDLNHHVAEEAHQKAQARLITLETHYIYIQRDLLEIKGLLKEMRPLSDPH